MIRTSHQTAAYRKGWDAIFGKRKADISAAIKRESKRLERAMEKAAPEIVRRVNKELAKGDL